MDPGGPDRRPSRPRQRGQSVVEFALVIPVLMVLVVGIADLGRIFAATVTVEGATRDAAESVSQAYLANPPGTLSAAPVPPAGYYGTLHATAATAICAETRGLPGVVVDPGTGSCSGMPLILVCVHDGADELCANEVNGATIPAQCTSMATAPTNASADGTRRYVEVRTCYRFDAMIHMPWFDFGTIWIERTRVFEIPCYFTLGPAACG